MSKYYELVKRNYDNGFWSIDRVANAVKARWITADEFYEITGHIY